MGELFRIFFDVIVPVFLLVLLGYTIGHRLGLQARTLSRYAYYILTPAFVFTRLAETEVAVALVFQMIGYMTVVTLTVGALGFALARALGRTPAMTAAFTGMAVFGNVGNFGFPLIQFALGEEALGIATIYFLVVLVLAFAIGVAAASFVQGGSLTAVLEVLKTPGVMIVPIAVLVNWLNLDLPLTLVRPVALLADALVPTMLLALGVQLAAEGIPRPNFDMAAVTAVRLIGGPVVAVLVAIPFGLTGLARDVGILQASMPIAVLVSIIAVEYDTEPTFTTATVLFSTLCSIVTITALMVLLF